MGHGTLVGRTIRGETGHRAGATVYRTAGRVLVYPVSTTDVGMGLLDPSMIVLPDTAGALEVGVAVRKALAASREEVPHPAPGDLARHSTRLANAAGFRSIRAMESGAVSCWVAAEGESVTVTPTRNGGTRGPDAGFQPTGAPDLVVPARGADEDLGRVVLAGLAASS